MDINSELVRKLIADQFPQWSELPVNTVQRGGWDNRTFRLGGTRSVRLPSAESYVPQVEKEQQWLPFLGEQLSIAIPEVCALGKPGYGYPWPWSVYKWIEGKDVELAQASNMNIALPLAQFINQLHKIAPSDGPAPGTHNYYRGGQLHHYHQDTQSYIKLLDKHIDAATALAVWHEALQSTWSEAPVWVHGDLEASNMLVCNAELAAVIDFGHCAVGDPACDLVMAWTYFDENARKQFCSHLSFDDDTWQRARAWALWKALFRMSQSVDQRDKAFYSAKQLVDHVLLTKVVSV